MGSDTTVREAIARARHRRAPLWWLAGMLGAISCLLSTSALLVSSTPGTAAASIGSDRGRVSQLEALIGHEGDVVQTLVERSNLVESHLLVVQKQVKAERAHLATDHQVQAKANAWLRSLAVDAYVNADASSGSALDSSSNTTQASEQQVYLGVASGSLNEAVAAVETDEHHTSVDEALLRSEQANLRTTLVHLAAARRSAQQAIARDETILRSVRGNLLTLVIEANEERQKAAEQAEEEREARQQQQHQQPPPPPPPPPKTSSGSYADPLRAISGLTPERIDQGVDYSGYGPIYAIGNGVVLSTVNGGWPGGTFIAYQLSSGPASGLVVYAAEDIQPSVSVGEDVTSGTVLGQMYEGPDGIETGWADGSALGETMAAEYGQFSGSNSTAFGYNFSQLLESTGAPGGVLQNDPPTGSLPSGWPQW